MGASHAFDVALDEGVRRGAEPPFLLNMPPCVLPGYEGRILRWGRDSAALYDRGRMLLVDPEDYRLDRPESAKDLSASAVEGKAKPASCSACVYADRCHGYEKRYLDRFGAAELTPLGDVPEPFHRGWKGVRSWRRMLTRKEHEALRAARSEARA